MQCKPKAGRVIWRGLKNTFRNRNVQIGEARLALQKKKRNKNKIYRTEENIKVIEKCPAWEGKGN